MNEYFLNEKVIVCKDTNEKCKGYNNYLNSIHWQKLRQNQLNEKSFRCQKCRKRKQHYELQIHHKTYKHLGHEHETDLILLCEDCHKKTHIKKEKIKKAKNKKRKNISKQ